MQKSPENFIALLKPVYGNAVKYCLALTRNDADAKDIFQESVLRAMQHFGSLRDETKFKSWFFTIITREYYALYRGNLSRKLFYKRFPVETTELPVVFSAEITDPRLPVLLRALDGLKPKERAALVLFEVGGFSIEEIKQIQQEGSLSAVKSRLSRARKKLVELIK